MRKPDWATLHSDLIDRIANLLIADDITHFIRLRAVCHPWRSSTEESKSRANYLYPRNWILLSDPSQSPRKPWCFHNTATNKSFSFDLKPYLQSYSLPRPFDCVFLLMNDDTRGIVLLNPFMRSVIELPSKIESRQPELLKVLRLSAPSQLVDLVYNPFTDEPLKHVFVTRSSTIVLVAMHLDYLAWTRPGDQTWVYDRCFVLPTCNVLFYEDRLLTIDLDDGLVQINFAGEMPQPEPEVVMSYEDQLPFLSARYLVDCGGDIFLASFRLKEAYEEYFWDFFELYRLDLNKKTYECTKNLGNHSIFLGNDRTISLCCKNLRGIQAYSTYVCKLYDGETACYNFTTKRVKYWSSKPFIRPSKLVKQLVSYCQRSHY